MKRKNEEGKRSGISLVKKCTEKKSNEYKVEKTFEHEEWKH